MKMIFKLSLMIFVTSFIIMMICNIISKKTFMDREKNSPFECGFDPMNSARIPFSIQFYLIAVIFLIFDVKITLLLPLIPSMEFSNLFSWFITSFYFIFILLIGLYHEWNQGALNWMK